MPSITPLSFWGMASFHQSLHLFRDLMSGGHTDSELSLNGLGPNILPISPGPACSFSNVKGGGREKEGGKRMEEKMKREKEGRKEGEKKLTKEQEQVIYLF